MGPLVSYTNLVCCCVAGAVALATLAHAADKTWVTQARFFKCSRSVGPVHANHLLSHASTGCAHATWGEHKVVGACVFSPGLHFGRAQTATSLFSASTEHSLAVHGWHMGAGEWALSPGPSRSQTPMAPLYAFVQHCALLRGAWLAQGRGHLCTPPKLCHSQPTAQAPPNCSCQTIFMEND